MNNSATYKQSNLVLNVDVHYDLTALDLGAWDSFLDVLCVDREYQKEAIKQAIIFHASGKYKNITDLIKENYHANSDLQNKYSTLEMFLKGVQLPNKLFANIDLATGTGKSFVMYGIAQIMLGLNLVDRVLVLCPSLTIERGLQEKFEQLSGNAQLKKSIPESARYQNPSIVDASVTVQEGSICIENIHAVYEKTGSSIKDSFLGKGRRVLVLNDESHHIFNKISGRTQEAKSLKKWKEFLLNPNYNFKYILGFTGTAYHDNEYFNDVIYRYSLRDAINDNVVKKVDYVQKDDSANVAEKLEKIYQNHQGNIDKYPKIKPLTIMVTKDIKNAKRLRQEVIHFLHRKGGLPREVYEEKVLIVTSNSQHKGNLAKLRSVDQRENPAEWIVSVSMLTEGWDVQNVFQIVPWEDRAFNSKLLIAQVLGRGLRVPKVYQSPTPAVIIFNHDSWSRGIKSLVEEVLEIENRLESQILIDGERSKYNFDLYNLHYTREEIEVQKKNGGTVFDYTTTAQYGIVLESQVSEVERETIYARVGETNFRSKNYLVEHETISVQEVLDKIFLEFENRNWNHVTLKIGDRNYTKENLPERAVIRQIVRTSMNRVGIKGDRLVKKNKEKILTTFCTIFRRSTHEVIIKRKTTEPFLVSTRTMSRETCSIGNFRRGQTVFYTNKWNDEIQRDEQRLILKDMREDDSLPKSAEKEQNCFLFKTPHNVVFTNAEPERKFIEGLCKDRIVTKLEAWVKSRDQGFYGIEYKVRYGGEHSKSRKYKQKVFNPDFFIKVNKDEIDYYIVVEIKSDQDISTDNKAKYRYAKNHFQSLNESLAEKNIHQKYLFHFLSPSGFDSFFEYLQDGRILLGQEKFRCSLENQLESM